MLWSHPREHLTLSLGPVYPSLWAGPPSLPMHCCHMQCMLITAHYSLLVVYEVEIWMLGQECCSFQQVWWPIDKTWLLWKMPWSLVNASWSFDGLQVANNSLSGCVPSQWPSSLKNITNIDLSNNQFSGNLPTTWTAQGAFPTLQQMWASSISSA